MSKQYQIELDRNERDFATFLKSRKVTLSKSKFRTLIASQALSERVSLFDIEGFKDKFNIKTLQCRTARNNNLQSKSKEKRNSLHQVLCGGGP